MGAAVAKEAELLSIGEVAALSRTPATTLRYYEKCGLLEPPHRVGGQRRYEAAVIGRLMVIRFCRVAGLGLDVIEQVLSDTSPNRRSTKELALAQVELIDGQIARLEMARRMMFAASSCRCPTLETCDCTAMDDVTAELRAYLAAEHEADQARDRA